MSISQLYTVCLQQAARQRPAFLIRTGCVQGCSPQRIRLEQLGKGRLCFSFSVPVSRTKMIHCGGRQLLYLGSLFASIIQNSDNGPLRINKTQRRFYSPGRNVARQV